jgi:hypothetical protein
MHCWQLSHEDLFNLFCEESIKNDVGRLNCVLFKVKYCINRLLNHFEEQLAKLALEHSFEYEVLDYALGHTVHLLAHLCSNQTIVDAGLHVLLRL